MAEEEVQSFEVILKKRKKRRAYLFQKEATGIGSKISCDQTLNNVCGCFSGDGNYIKNLTRNLNALERAVKKLIVNRAGLSSLVSIEERKGLQRLADVQLWLNEAGAIEHQAYALISLRDTETERLCMSAYCSNNVRASYVYGKTVFKTLKDVERLNNSRKDFNAVAEEVHIKVVQRPIKPTVGLDLVMQEEVGTLGIYGMGGVGKTTFLTQLNNKFARQMNGFDIVIWVTVSRDGRIARIQEQIGKRLSIHDARWVQKEEEEKASDIHNILMTQRFVLLLDDVWSGLDLQKIGVPYPSRENGCKIAFTARSLEVMRVDAEMTVTCLEPDDAWELFQNQVGDITLNYHEDIPKLAGTLAARCRGLPLALTVIGGAMSCKRTFHQWQHAINYFDSPESQFPGMTDQILPMLRFSYDDLKDDTAKLCFQYCALFPEDYEIEIEALIDYWIGEGFIQGRSRDFAVNDGYAIIGKLVRTCLLMNDESKGIVKMHDVVREMALAITRSSPYSPFNFIVETETSLHELPDYNTSQWMEVGRMSLMGNQIQKAFCCSDCPKLLTLFLHNNDLLDLCSQFFWSMPKLVVLDLSRNYNLRVLPNISNLTSLQYLDLSHTELKLLPSGLCKLESLIHLNLEFTMELSNIDQISSLRKLQVLKLLGSGSSFSTFRALCTILDFKTLEVLTICIDDDICWEILQCNHILARCIEVLSLRTFILPAMTIQAKPVWYSLRNLEIRDSEFSEIYIDTGDYGNFVDLHPCNSGSSSRGYFPNLSRVEIINCKSLRHLTWLLYASNLTQLRVVRSSRMEGIICKQKTADEQREVVPFQKLQLLHLQDLGELKAVHWSPLPFPRLTEVIIFGCPELKKLPLHYKSAEGQNLIIDAEKEWFDELEWEDDATKQRFAQI